MGIFNFHWCAVDISSNVIDLDINTYTQTFIFKMDKILHWVMLPKAVWDIIHLHPNLLINFTLPKEEQ